MHPGGNGVLGLRTMVSSLLHKTASEDDALLAGHLLFALPTWCDAAEAEAWIERYCSTCSCQVNRAMLRVMPDKLRLRTVACAVHVCPTVHILGCRCLALFRLSEGSRGRPESTTTSGHPCSPHPAPLNAGSARRWACLEPWSRVRGAASKRLGGVRSSFLHGYSYGS